MTHKYGVPKPTKRHAKAKKPIPRKSRPTASNPTRKALTFARCYGSKARVEWVKATPCVIAPVVSVVSCGQSENAHVPSRSGAGRKGDAKMIVPLCKWHHTESPNGLHALGLEKFNAFWLVDLIAEAAKVEARWQAASHV